MNLLTSIKNLPKDSGIYEYFDEFDRILYIGKAKNLKKRISSYFNLSDGEVKPSSKLSPRIYHMVQKIKYIKTIIVNSEQDALILENSLIKQLKPKYNILLRDDKTYPYILIDKSSPFPTLEVARKVVKNKDFLYFGPYASGIKDIIDSIYEILPLVQKKSCLREKKACLFYQINRCYAPCEGRISQDEYNKIIKKAIDLLKNPNKLMRLLHTRMLSLASNLQFEEANVLKFRIKKISQFSNFSTIDLAKLYNFDIFAIYSSNSKKSVLMKLFMRDGKITSSDYYFINHNDNDINLSYLYSQALINHYKNNIALNLDSILLPIDLESKDEILSFIQSDKKISITKPKNKAQQSLIDLALNNAKNIIESNSNDKLLESIQTLLRLQNIPYRIEVFDTSHHSGDYIVGGMIVWQDGEFVKDGYRRYNLKGADEYSQMQELLSRRAKDFSTMPPPDLWLIDGGKGQINIARNVLDSSGANVDIVAIAKEKIDSKAYRSKGGANDILRTNEFTLKLNKSDERLLFLQKLRDEVHRYAITFHRQKKIKNMLDSMYSKAQIKKLLSHFGSFENINNANSETIKEILKKKF